MNTPGSYEYITGKRGSMETFEDPSTLLDVFGMHYTTV